MDGPRHYLAVATVKPVRRARIPNPKGAGMHAFGLPGNRWRASALVTAANLS
ncbi:hypothetical protein FHX72_003480 [Pseudoclavibacter helvolus]|uniref:Uncharacterized protein n=1 Tax=Pseudoclavibacter helvolus TaxID=255205 RepID=A0A7W4YHS3_9MICO|nr:hypothetical protein [Pseudoclavibacter helvolus]